MPISKSPRCTDWSISLNETCTNSGRLPSPFAICSATSTSNPRSFDGSLGSASTNGAPPSASPPQRKTGCCAFAAEARRIASRTMRRIARRMIELLLRQREVSCARAGHDAPAVIQRKRVVVARLGRDDERRPVRRNHRAAFVHDDRSPIVARGERRINGAEVLEWLRFVRIELECHVLQRDRQGGAVKKARAKLAQHVLLERIALALRGEELRAAVCDGSRVGMGRSGDMP